jgi:hypothetical protein
MRFRGTYRGIDFDLNKYTSVLDERMREHLEEGARLWIEATTGRVPLWSGMARASLLKISQLVSGRIALAPLKGKSRIPQGTRLGEAELTAKFPDYKIEIATRVEHYVIQEDRNVGKSKSAPWRSFSAGADAFIAYAGSIGLPPVVFRRKLIKKV